MVLRELLSNTSCGDSEVSLYRLAAKSTVNDGARYELTNGPLVSVILPIYNRAYLLKRSIQSILNQTYQNFEIIVLEGK
jgi:cellulose synthase/poly-beta-1,6-N-acetylglucosamine synthase-like glycosyltransferase